MFGLIPKETKFFDMFENMGKIIVDAAVLLKQLMDNFDNPVDVHQLIKNLEHQGDMQTHEVIKKLNKSFITPFDSDDIYKLASALDDVIDLIDASSKDLVTYHVTKITPEAKELAFIILKSCQSLEKAIGLLSKNNNVEKISEYCVEVNSLENEADRVRQEAISKLFAEEKDPIELMKWKEIYEILELATDKCEDAANILESVVLKNA